MPTTFPRGRPGQREEHFAYDAAGNWLGYTTKANGATSLDQRRAHNDLNQITSLSTANAAWDAETNPLASDKVHHDANGNMLLLPHGPAGEWDQSMKLTWDAWNRLVKAEKASDSTVIASYEYDGLWRRTVKRTAWETRHYYYNSQWRSIEEHVEATGGAHVVEQQHLWGPHHRWEYHRRDRNTHIGTATALDEILYALKDAMSLTAIADTTGTIKERYQYSAFGQRLCLAPDGNPLTESTVKWRLGFHVEFVDATAATQVDTGLTNYGYRYYDATGGRWLGRDPLHERGGRNLQAMISNNPTGSRDRLGLAAAAECCGPDISDALDATHRDMEKAFEAADDQTRKAACSTARGDKGWDTDKLVSEDKLPNPTGDFNGVSCGQEKGKCASTVTVQGQCYPRGDVNYLTWGKLTRLCQQNYYWNKNLLRAHKSWAHGEFKQWGKDTGSQQWMDAGYNGWISNADYEKSRQDSLNSNRSPSVGPSTTHFPPDRDDWGSDTPPKPEPQPSATASADCKPCSKKAPAKAFKGHFGDMHGRIAWGSDS